MTQCKKELNLYEKKILLQLINYSGFSHGDYGNEDDCLELNYTFNLNKDKANITNITYNFIYYYVNVNKIESNTTDIDKLVMKYLSNTNYYICVCYFESCMNYIKDLSREQPSWNGTEGNETRKLYLSFTQHFGIENNSIDFYIPDNDKENEKPFLFSIFILAIYLTVMICLDIYQRTIQFKTMINIKEDIPKTEEESEEEENKKEQKNEDSDKSSSLQLFKSLIQEGELEKIESKYNKAKIIL